MQTFLPYEYFKDCASVLDKKRCWKQVVECKQLLATLRVEGLPEDWKESKSWINQSYINHPATKMWIGYEMYLAMYYNEMLMRCKDHWKIDTTLPFVSLYLISNKEIPWWLGNLKLHYSHQARLYTKDPEYYSNFLAIKDFNEARYWWPDNETKTFKII